MLQKDTLEVFIFEYELLEIVKRIEKSTGGKLVEAEFEDALGEGTTHIELHCSELLKSRFVLSVAPLELLVMTWYFNRMA